MGGIANATPCPARPTVPISAVGGNPSSARPALPSHPSVGREPRQAGACASGREAAHTGGFVVCGPVRAAGGPRRLGGAELRARGDRRPGATLASAGGAFLLYLRGMGPGRSVRLARRVPEAVDAGVTGWAEVCFRCSRPVYPPSGGRAGDAFMCGDCYAARGAPTRSELRVARMASGARLLGEARPSRERIRELVTLDFCQVPACTKKATHGPGWEAIACVEHACGWPRVRGSGDRNG